MGHPCPHDMPTTISETASMHTLAKFRATAAALAGLCALFIGNAAHAAGDEPRRPECIAPAQPGGGFDLTCRLATEGLKQSGALKAPMRIVYMPGGIGAVAYNNIVAQHRARGRHHRCLFRWFAAQSGARQVRQVFGRRRALAGRYRRRLWRGRGPQRFALYRPQGPDGGLQAGSHQDRAGRRRHRGQPGLDESGADGQGGRR